MPFGALSGNVAQTVLQDAYANTSSICCFFSVFAATSYLLMTRFNFLIFQVCPCTHAQIGLCLCSNYAHTCDQTHKPERRKNDIEKMRVAKRDVVALLESFNSRHVFLRNFLQLCLSLTYKLRG